MAAASSPGSYGGFHPSGSVRGSDFGVGAGDLSLPIDELDAAFMFAPWAVLWEQTWPVLPVGIDLDASHTQGEAHPVMATHDDDMGGDFVDDVWVPEVTRDPQAIDVSRSER